MIRVRFAPVPVGHLFLGSARIALANHLFARPRGGHVLLRFADLDSARCRPAFMQAMQDDLRWLGADWDAIAHQSANGDRYAAAIDRLKASGRLYPCFESAEELRAKADLRRKRGQAAIYDRAMLALTERQRMDAEAGGKRPYWRYRLSDSDIGWVDLIAGRRGMKLSAVSDPVLVREDGTPDPLLADLVDDLRDAITHVIRDDDGGTNTAIQIDLRRVLGADRPEPAYASLPPMGGGKPRVASRTVRDRRQDGVTAAALRQWLVGDARDLSDLPRGWDPAALPPLNRSVLATMDAVDVADWLPDGAPDSFWQTIRGHIDLLTEVAAWWEVVTGATPVPPHPRHRALLQRAAEALPAEPWNDATWPRWLDRLGRDAGPVLRDVLTQEADGPPMDRLLPLMRRPTVLRRLEMAGT